MLFETLRFQFAVVHSLNEKALALLYLAVATWCVKLGTEVDVPTEFELKPTRQFEPVA